MYNAYGRIVEYLNFGSKVTILYFGDHDPSGLDMLRDITDRLTNFLLSGKKFTASNEKCLNWLRLEFTWVYDILIETDAAFMAREWWIKYAFKVVPLGLTAEQIRDYNPPPNPAKISDPRAAWYIAQHGEVSYEVDALSPSVMSDIVEEGITSNMDMERYRTILTLESENISRLETFIENFS
jgi:hypothetical protein